MQPNCHGEQIHEGAPHVAYPQTRPRDVAPLEQRHLLEGGERHRIGGTRAAEQPADQLHVEDPARPERVGDRGSYGRRRAEDLRAALRVS